ncbi:MAG: Asp-tRNA(Asn)/Glu-tRNA(Gln) amidotransferase subunit GatA [Candidatus Buchananbacteria bacterium]
MALNELTLLESFEGLRDKKFSSEELTKACFDQIEKHEDKIKAFVTLDKDGALLQAKKVDEKIKNGESLSPLAGIPVSVKDLLCTTGVRTTAASKILENYIPPFDATVVKILKDNDSVIVGKTNLDEFAMGGSTENSAFFTTHNPWDLDRVPGGTSGGSTASIAADESIFSIGTDTGGSIRQPASFCGVTGLKVSYGRVSRYGVVADASSLDTIGPIGKSVEDVALILKYIAGRDPKDSTTPPIDVDDYLSEIKKDINGLKIGLPKEYFIEGMDEGVRTSILEALKKFEELGAEILDISLPMTDFALASYYVIQPAEVSSNLAKYDGIKYGLSKRDGDLLNIYLQSRAEGFGQEAKRRIMIGTYALSAGYYDAYYKKAMKVRTLVKKDFDDAFEKVDVILTPVAPTTAYKIGEKISDPLKMYLEDVFTVPASLAGICGLSIPAGMANGLPVGMQILGKRFDEKTILRAGHQFQQITDWHKQKPQLK